LPLVTRPEHWATLAGSPSRASTATGGREDPRRYAVAKRPSVA
jgi:hypothetical protein